MVMVCAAGAVYNLDGYSLPDGLFGVFNALGTVAFAYGGHNVILEIQVCLCRLFPITCCPLID